MSKVKILVVEDEIVIADSICDTLETLGYEPMEVAINYTEALQALEEELPDLVMLDIQLAGSKDGIDLAWKIKEDYGLPFIFLTSNADKGTIDRAKLLSPPAYLVKPFSKDDLYTSIELALFNSDNSAETSTNTQNAVLKDAIFVKDKNLFHKVKFDDILFAKSEHVYVELYTTQGKNHLIRTTMNAFSERLPENFFRVHRSYTVNLNHLDTINSLYVVIANEEIPIGKAYRDQLMQLIRIE